MKTVLEREAKINPVISIGVVGLTHGLAEEAGEENMGVMVLAFDLGEGGRMFFGSNGKRADVCAALVEFLSKLAPDLLEEAIGRWKNQGLLGPGAERIQ